MISDTVMYIASVEDLKNEELYDAAFSAASESRREKTVRYKQLKDRCLSLGAETLLRYGLNEAGIKNSEVKYSKTGKPYLSEGGMFFNIAHSEKYAVCAISQLEVGCDTERATEVKNDIARRFFNKAEYLDIISQPDIEKSSDLFFRYWSLKESFIKTVGLGLKLPLDSFRIVLGKDISVIQSVDERSYAFSEFDGISGYKCALCTAGRHRAEFKMIKLDEIL